MVEEGNEFHDPAQRGISLIRRHSRILHASRSEWFMHKSGLMHRSLVSRKRRFGEIGILLCLGGRNGPTELSNSFSIDIAKNMCYVSGLKREFMTSDDKDRLLRQYAAGEITWSALRERGFEDYVQVLGGLGNLGLRPPIAAMEGPNLAARQRGRALLRDALKARLA